MENICEWENCKESGKFKAPLEKDNSKNYKWLCEEHIKSFNKNWNYFAGMSKKETLVNSVNGKKLSEKDKDAFRIMELEFSSDWSIIQKKFKTLVKKFHPDKHSGNKQMRIN